MTRIEINFKLIYLDREYANCMGLLYSLKVSDMYNLEDSPPASEGSRGEIEIRHKKFHPPILL